MTFHPSSDLPCLVHQMAAQRKNILPKIPKEPQIPRMPRTPNFPQIPKKPIFPQYPERVDPSGSHRDCLTGERCFTTLKR